MIYELVRASDDRSARYLLLYLFIFACVTRNQFALTLPGEETNYPVLGSKASNTAVTSAYLIDGLLSC